MINTCKKFFEISLKEPDKTAIIFGDERISYKELSNRADSIAAYLCAYGIGGDALVGIYLPRSTNLIVSLIGILKVGAGYIPLDLSFPQDRISYMLSNSGAKVVITSKSVKNISQFSVRNVKIIYIENIDISKYENTHIDIREGIIAYVIYTSGSTGKPKGVEMGHRALDNLINWQGRTSQISRGITLQYAPLSFDVSFQEIFSTLSFGGTLVLCNEEMRRDPEKMMSLILDQKIERIFLPFIALQQVAEFAHDRSHLSNLREVITAGEQLRVTPAIRLFFQGLPNCKLINQYGPTETHVVTSYELLGSPDQWPHLPPIGKPIQNVRLFILDDLLREMSINEAGELHIGGICLADGYVNNQLLTESAFVVHPRTGERLYKTGDDVRLLSGGDLEFIGRKDTQIKLRGYRIELGEIEAALSEHTGIKDCVVDIRKGVLDQGSLIAYLVIRDGYKSHLASASATTQWSLFLKNKLPDYMIPSKFLVLESLPLTPTGKVDRKSLPNPSAARPDLITPFTPPSNEIEIKIAEIWKEFLQIEEVGVDDNFFELGGNSLLTTYVQQKLSQILPFKIEIVDLFQYPTTRSLAKEFSMKINPVEGTANGIHKSRDISIANRRINARKRYER